ncbi:MAG: hypothetical protein WA364_04815 [Candidatus Nitrosopolaris sp.]
MNNKKLAEQECATALLNRQIVNRAMETDISNIYVDQIHQAP